MPGFIPPNRERAPSSTCVVEQMGRLIAQETHVVSEVWSTWPSMTSGS